jgi:hypothetical protein
MDLLTTAKQKLEVALEVINSAHDYTQSIKPVLAALDDGLEFTKKHYSELNTQTLNQGDSLKGSDIYFFFMRFTHQFFNVMNIIQTIPNVSYYEKFLYVLKARQQRFDEICAEAKAKASEILTS